MIPAHFFSLKVHIHEYFQVLTLGFLGLLGCLFMLFSAFPHLSVIDRIASGTKGFDTTSHIELQGAKDCSEFLLTAVTGGTRALARECLVHTRDPARGQPQSCLP